jgi:RNA polymerase sigma factor (sigma-70 family)
VYRYARGLLDRPADAEDATQTTFLNAYRALERGEQPRNTRTWLHAIALNVCREYHRRARRRPDEISLEEDPGELVLDPPALGIGDVIRGLRQLPFNQRAALVMREFEGRSLAEIATALEVSVSAVETLLFRARRSLREQLDGALTCAEAEQAISRQLDGALPRDERGPLRAHLRQCPECATLARRLRAQGSAIKSLAAIPIPATLVLGRLTTGGAGATASSGATAGASASGGLLGLGGGASVLGSVGAKLAIATLAGAAGAGVGYVSLSHKSSRPTGSPRLASTAGRGTYPGAAVAKPVGRGGHLIVTASAPGHRRLSAGLGSSTNVGRGTTTKTLPATADGYAYGHTRGVRAHVSPSGNSNSATGSSSVAGSAGQSHPTRPQHPVHPVRPTHPVTSRSMTTTTSTATKTPNHGSGNGIGYENSKHQ